MNAKKLRLGIKKIKIFCTALDFSYLCTKIYYNTTYLI